MTESTDITEGISAESLQQILKISSWLIAIGLLLTGIGGAFLPWIWREAVALQLTAPGLAEFVKFLPEIRTLQIDMERLFFLAPLFLAMLMLPLFAVNTHLLLPVWMRWLMRLAVFPLALASISPVWKPSVLMAEEFRLQTILAVVAIIFTIIAPLLKNIPLKFFGAIWLVGGALAIMLSMQQFNLAQESIATAYDQPVSLGWGWWLTVAGIIITLVGIIFSGTPGEDENEDANDTPQPDRKPFIP